MDVITVTPADACRITGIGKTKLYELLGNGTVESVVIGRRRLVKVASLRRLVGADEER
jgi:excisionase family DNA binding protein